MSDSLNRMLLLILMTDGTLYGVQSRVGRSVLHSCILHKRVVCRCASLLRTSKTVLLDLCTPVTDVLPTHADDCGVILRLRAKDTCSDATDSRLIDLVNHVTHLRDRNFAAMDEDLKRCEYTFVGAEDKEAYLPAKILNFDRPTLKRHDQA